MAGTSTPYCYCHSSKAAHDAMQQGSSTAQPSSAAPPPQNVRRRTQRSRLRHLLQDPSVWIPQNPGAVCPSGHLQLPPYPDFSRIKELSPQDPHPCPRCDANRIAHNALTLSRNWQQQVERSAARDREFNLMLAIDMAVESNTRALDDARAIVRDAERRDALPPYTGSGNENEELPPPYTERPRDPPSY